MKAVFKYQLPLMENSFINMHDGAEIIRCDGLDGFLWIWAVVDTDKPVVRREFKMFKTGGQMPADLKLRYLGCGAIFVQMELMMYIFEVEKEAA